MAPTVRASLTATAVLAIAAALSACSSAPAATLKPSAAASAAVSTTAVATLAPTATASLASTATPASAQPSASAIASELVSPSTSHAPIATPVPGSTLDPAQSDAGVVGRVTIADDTRAAQNGTTDRTGTHDIVGHKADGSFGSFCEFSIDGNEFTASANFDAAAQGQIGEMLISIPTDEMPANDGETRSDIVDGRVSVYFVDENPLGTTYAADETATSNPGTDTINVSQVGQMIIFDFTATTWDNVDFSGEMRCAGTGE
jgi:hypothetical protein